MKSLRLALVLLLAPALAAAAPSFGWMQTYEGGGNYLDEATLALTDPEGNLVLGGVSHDGIDGLDVLVCKLSRETGTVLWETRQEAFDTNDMAVSGMCWDGQADLLVAGYVVGCVG
jgi:hypothetical protein